MDREKMIKQAKILREKKFNRMVAVAKQLRPKVQDGVVVYDTPIAKKATDVRSYAAPPVTATRSRKVLPKAKVPTEQQQIQTQQKINPHKIVKRKGCSGCRRKIGQK